MARYSRAFWWPDLGAQGRLDRQPVCGGEFGSVLTFSFNHQYRAPSVRRVDLSSAEPLGDESRPH